MEQGKTGREKGVLSSCSGEIRLMNGEFLRLGLDHEREREVERGLLRCDSVKPKPTNIVLLEFN